MLNANMLHVCPISIIIIKKISNKIKKQLRMERGRGVVFCVFIETFKNRKNKGGENYNHRRVILDI